MRPRGTLDPPRWIGGLLWGAAFAGLLIAAALLAGHEPAAAAGSSYRSAVMADNPIGYWRLGEASGTTAADEVTVPHSGTYLGGVLLGQPGAIQGDSNTAATLDGTNDTIRVRNVAVLNPTAGLSIEAWANRSSAVQSSVVRKDTQYLLRATAGGALVCRLVKGGSDKELKTAATNLLPMGTWHHVVCSWDGTTMTLYVDGVSRGTLGAAAPIDTSTNDFFIGSTNNSYDWFGGGIDDVALYDHALTADRVQAHYNASPDLTPPTVTLTAPAPGSSTSHTKPTFAGTAGTTVGDLATVTVKVYSGGTPTGVPSQTLSTTRDPSGAFSVDAGQALADGAYTARAEQADSAGNTGLSSPATFSVDTIAPSPSITLPANGSSINNTTPALAGTAGTASGDSTNVTVKLYAGSSATGVPLQTLTTTRAAGGSFSVEASTLGEGNYTARAEQSDGAGNVGAGAPTTFLVDTTAPSLRLDAPVDATSTNDTTPTFAGAAATGTGDSANVTVKVYAGSSPTGPVIQTLSGTRGAGGSFSVDASSGLSDGTYTARAEQSDAAGNTGLSAPATFRIDTTGPSPRLDTPGNGSVGNDATPTFAGVAGIASGDSSNLTVRVYSGTSTDNPLETLDVTRDDSGAFSIDASPALADGSYIARAEQVDDAGNIGMSAQTTFSIDTSGLAVRLITPADGGASNDTTPTFSGTAATRLGDSLAVTVNVYGGNAATGTPVLTLTATRDLSGAFSIDAPQLMAEGTYTAQAQQSDASGNTGLSAPATFRIDTTAPALHIPFLPDGSSTNDTTPLFRGTAGTAAGDSPSIAVKVYAGSQPSGTPLRTLSATRGAKGAFSLETAPSLAEGTYTAQGEQTDDAGNRGTSSLVPFTIDTTAPSVRLTAPTDGSSTSDTTPVFSGVAGNGTGDFFTVTVKLYTGTSASGTPIQVLKASRDSAGSFSIETQSALPQGTYSARAEQPDGAGNLGLSSSTTFSVIPYRDEVLADGPVAYWRLGESSGTAAADDTGNGNTGTYAGSPALGQSGALHGDPNTSVTFDGVNDGVKIRDASTLNQRNALTIEAWINRTDAIQSTVIRKDSQYLLRVTAGGAVVCRFVKGGSDRELKTPNAVPTGGWHHLVCTWDGATMTIYVDGVSRATLSVPAPIDATTNDLFIGSTNNSYDWYAGGIDEVAVYGRALSASRILDHYYKGVARDSTAPTVTLMAPANASPTEATPNLGGLAGTAAGDSANVVVRIYAGTTVSGSPVQTLTAAVQSAGTFSVRATPLASGPYTAQAEQLDNAGNSGRSAANTFQVNASADPTLLAAGDIAGCDSFGDEATALLLDRLPGTVQTLGDNVYEYGTAEEFANCYDPTWGRHKARTHPAVNGHEYHTTNAAPYYDYFGTAAGDPTKGYYSYDLGTWHIIVANSECDEIGGCEAGSVEEQWLRQDLASHPAQCTLAVIHVPRFSSGTVHGDSDVVQDLWQALYEWNAELVLSGDDHLYERFAPQTPDGGLNNAAGLREFVVGNGGRSHYPFGNPKPNSEVRNNDAFGALKLALHSGSYDWQFVPEAGKTFTDSGSSSCH